MAIGEFYILAIVLMLQGQEFNAHVTDVICDPDVPSRPQPWTIESQTPKPKSNKPISTCPGGEYLDFFKCEPCGEGTFRTKQIAALNKFSSCQKCQEPGMYEIIREPCTKSRDAKIMCEDGFYRYEVPGQPCRSGCFRCTICGVDRLMFKNYVARKCGGYNNTFCCEREDMVEKDGRCVVETSTRKPTTPTTTRKMTTPTTPTTTSYMTYDEDLYEDVLQADFGGQSAIYRESNWLRIICLVTIVLCK